MSVRIESRIADFWVRSIPLCGLTEMGLVDFALHFNSFLKSLPSADHVYGLAGIFIMAYHICHTEHELRSQCIGRPDGSPFRQRDLLGSLIRLC
jgi:hypothetical protein